MQAAARAIEANGAGVGLQVHIQPHLGVLGIDGRSLAPVLALLVYYRIFDL
jgi:hypothetical protein